jgi:hypothetical protein
VGWLDRIKDKKEQDKIPAKWRDKTTEEIAAELDNADKLRADLATEKLAREADSTKVAEIQTEFEKVKTQLAAAEANRNKPPDKKPDNVDPTPENMLENPKGVLDTRLGPLEAATIRNGVTTSRMLAQQQLDNADMASDGKDMNGRLFRAWGAEIDTEARKYQAVQLMSPEAWIGIFWYLKGVHADELRDPETRKKKYNFLEPSTSGAPAAGTNGNMDKKDGPESLTDQEKHVADKMGVSYENYAKRKKAMVMVNV